MRVKIVQLLVSVTVAFALSTCSDLRPPVDPAPPPDTKPAATYGILRIVDEDVFTDGSFSYIGATIDGVEQGVNGGSVADSSGHSTDFTLSTGDHQVHLWKVIMHPGGYYSPFTSDSTITIRKNEISVWTL